MPLNLAIYRLKMVKTTLYINLVIYRVSIMSCVTLMIFCSMSCMTCCHRKSRGAHLAAVDVVMDEVPVLDKEEVVLDTLMLN